MRGPLLRAADVLSLEPRDEKKRQEVLDYLE
jgi:hypothetical protein